MQVKSVMVCAAALVSLAGSALGAEFQPLGALGIGGAGVARQNGALTAYWNPAGGAFNDKTFSFVTGGEIGAQGNNGLTENIDSLSKLDFNNIKNFNSGTATPQTVGDVVKLVTILGDIKNKNGSFSVSASAPVGFAVKHFSFGVFGSFEGFAQPLPDTVNLLPNQGSGTTISATDLYNAAATVPDPGNNGYFSPQQYSDMVAVFTKNGLDPSKAAYLVDVIESQMKGSGVSPSSVTAASTGILNNALTNDGSATIDKNNTSVMTKALLYFEAPLAYGHPFDLGKFGVLGIGASVKVIQGTVYQNQVLLVNTPSPLKSEDLIKEIRKNSETTTTFGVDLGMLWKYQDTLSIGVVGKNLNSPKFHAPTYQAPQQDNPTASVPVKGSDVTLDPQVRGGIAYDPWHWLTLAADMDITENASVVPNSAVKTRNVGGGFEMHPYSWLKFRLGAYQNLAVSGVGPVGTAGFTLGPFDIDGAASTDTFKVGGTKVPQEAKLQLLCGFTF
jgi:hypothetical protein